MPDSRAVFRDPKQQSPLGSIDDEVQEGTVQDFRLPTTPALSSESADDDDEIEFQDCREDAENAEEEERMGRGRGLGAEKGRAGTQRGGQEHPRADVLGGESDELCLRTARGQAGRLMDDLCNS